MTAAAGRRAAAPVQAVGWRTYVLLAMVSLVLFLPGRARLPPVDRDEARYLQATRQMLQTRDFIDIRFQDQPRNLQPAGVYWLEAGAATLFGGADAPVWAYRLPSLAAGVAAVLLTCRVGALLFGPRAGVGAALLMAASALLGFEARMAKIDACLLADVLVVQGALLKAYLGRFRGAGRVNAAVLWAAVGFGLLLKGPIVLIVCGTTALGVSLLDRRWAWLKRLHAGWGAPLALAIAAPWFVAIGVRTHGGFFDKAVRQNLLGKVGRGEQHHGQPPGYYLLMASLTFWPGVLGAIFSAPWGWRMRRTPAVRFLLAWLLPTWLLYEAVGTKLPHYMLPIYPALACLAAGAAVSGEAWRRSGAAWVRRALAWLYAGVWLIVGAAFALAGPVLVWRLEHRLDGVAMLFAGVGLLLCGAVLALVRRREAGLALAAGTAAAAVIYAGLYDRDLPELRTVWLAPRVAELTVRVRPCPGSVLASTRFAEPSLVFLERGPTRMIAPAPAADLLAGDGACAMALVSDRQLPVFLARATADRLRLRTLGEVDGVSYSRGEQLRLLLFAVAARGVSKGPPG